MSTVRGERKTTHKRVGMFPKLLSVVSHMHSCFVCEDVGLFFVCDFFHTHTQNHANPGDRVAVAISQFSSKKFERGLICEPNSVPFIHRAIARIDHIRFFKESIKNNSKFHITIGHNTTVATIYLFRKCKESEVWEHRSMEGNPKWLATKQAAEGGGGGGNKKEPKKKKKEKKEEREKKKGDDDEGSEDEEKKEGMFDVFTLACLGICAVDS